jgi:hypothetical protein
MLSPTQRRTAVRKLAVAAAALAVCVFPTACDYPLASPPGAPTTPGGSGTDATTAPVVVPVGNTTSARSTRDRDGNFTRTRTERPSSSSSSSAAPTSTTTATDTGTATGTATETPTTTSGTATDVPAGGVTATTAPPTTSAAATTISRADLLGRTCREGSNRRLPAHTGFQDKKSQCVSTQMGAVAANDRLPSLLIVGAPTAVKVGEGFNLEVSTRNLIRDRFLGAAAGGYYLEASFLDPRSGLQRGHFHTACRMLGSTSEAPDSSPAPAFFLATQDKGGSATPDKVTIAVPGTSTAKQGTMQCSSWAGDGSHRTPMMSFANQTPAFDSVRINIGGNAAVLPDAPAAGAPADAQADAQKQADAQAQEAGQAPDQNGAAQWAGVETVAPAAPAAPADESAAAADPAPADESSAPASEDPAATDDGEGN